MLKGVLLAEGDWEAKIKKMWYGDCKTGKTVHNCSCMQCR